MSINADRPIVRQIIRATLAASCACAADDLTNTGVTFVMSRDVSGRMRFPIPAKALSIVTMGAGVVVSAHAERLGWLRATLGIATRDVIFSAPIIGELARYVAHDGQDLRGPDLKYACARCDLRPVDTPDGITIRLVERGGVADLYQHRGFRMALSYPQDGAPDPRPDVLATVATRNGAIIGIAGASADSDDLWQVGIDVIESERGHGIGRALVGHLTRGILDAGKIPYYTTAVSNIGSRTIAIGLGYWPVWTEMYARDRRVVQP